VLDVPEVMRCVLLCLLEVCCGAAGDALYATLLVLDVLVSEVLKV